jgi:hypothetical protein
MLLAYFFAGAILFLIPAWRIFRRAGLDPWISLTVLIPGIGPLIALAVLAFADWPAARDIDGDASGGPAGAL